MGSAHPHRHRVLAVLSGTAAENANFEPAAFRTLSQLAVQQSQESRAEVDVLSRPSLQHLLQSVQQFQPSLVYFCQQVNQETVPAEQDVLLNWQGRSLTSMLCVTVFTLNCT